MKTKNKNRLFKRLTREQKAVAIAKDVIAQIKLGTFWVTTAVYCDLDISDDKGKDLQKILKYRITRHDPCTVCAIGSSFVSAVRLYDKFKITGEIASAMEVPADAMRDKLTDFFIENELYMLESCFELASGMYLGLNEFSVVTQEWESRCGNLAKFLQCFNNEERLLWLMQVIITNEGRFTFDHAKRAALVTLGSSTEERWVTFRKELLSSF